LRRKLPQLVIGAYEPLAAQGDLLLYRRSDGTSRVTVALNFGANPVSAAIGCGGEVLLSTFLDRQGEAVKGVLDLRGNEGIVIGCPAHAG